ncbi:glycine zipper 2TM domain-containing protein [Xinfangfangia pollutisoli]|uniref:glycine zipper 2TM domain-containing protein n=1 Tax=Xinfangfangia pollutisoli TaxID=2865960 RepID=UPI001CD6C5C2|nr:glycine zipper 2TM domain-containing protein [Xinfangfangia pollutisoli]
MKSVFYALPVVAALGLSACVATPEQNTAVGALTGAAIGTAVSGKGDKTQGALTGAALGAIAGTYMGQSQKAGQCYYSDGRGGRYIAAC